MLQYDWSKPVKTLLDRVWDEGLGNRESGEVGLMNKPPGHYRDEKGHEFYWDGQRRSYIPHDSFGQFMTDMNKVTLGVVGVCVLIPVAIVLVFLTGWALWAVLHSPVALLSVFAVGGIIFFQIVHHRRWAEEERNREAEEERARVQQRAEADGRRERKRREESEARTEAKKKRIKETEAAISGYLAEGIRQDFVGKTQDDFLSPEHHPFEEVYAGMTEEERIRHVNYVSANTTLKQLDPSAFMDPVQADRYLEAHGALMALGYYPRYQVEEALKDTPPQESVEQYIRVALRRIGTIR